MSTTTKHVVRQWRKIEESIRSRMESGELTPSEAWDLRADLSWEILDDNARRERAMARLMGKP